MIADVPHFERKGFPMSIWLVMQSSDGLERAFAVRKPTTVIGRETTCDVRVPVLSVAHKHCQLTFDGDQLKMTDLQSERGTLHNGNRVTEAVLSPDDTITIGPVTFIVRVEQSASQPNGTEAPPEIVIERHDVNGMIEKLEA
jgi:pSer/pThr/pTyr-binding forkhead associated (FHA) protein